ncbi:NAD-dependent epimerase [Syntrophomonas wolfei]|uniref:Nucleotide sugar epimerase n=1 Tax=Syntrophomonas wolfei subsp. wolfei (strain DSM 2245B / Goettingen) TaxID=335541 RepID=Q0AZ23_SYNWW|nr:NAD-dependent epimerase [Syntrophomonas wolfei]ABI68031.1 nucleotide sugar epimerase [Syntrophomonas wolfei subsp. wolfei str. Goettingen G311]
MKTVIVTGAAGFIGSKVSKELLKQGYTVIGIDNLNDYYDVQIKYWRLATLKEENKFVLYTADVENIEAIRFIFKFHQPDAVINLAARAGVRYSMENPHIYMTTNAHGTLNLLELCKEFGVRKFVLASTSSLYAGQEMPFKEELPVNTPISPYAASKKAAEMMAYTYHYLYGLDITVFRYFTVYGPAGRPDMSIFRFIKWIMEGTPLQVFGDGSQRRDFTYVDDIARGTVLGLKPMGYEIINLGNSNPDTLSKTIELIEEYTGKKTEIQYKEFHKADISATWANISKAQNLLGWQAKTNLPEGIKRTVQWMKDNWEWIQSIKLL